MPSNDIVLGYAFLKASAAYQKITSPIDALDALVLRAVIRVQGKTFIASSLQTAMKQVWGLVIPTAVCQYALGRLKTQGHLKLTEEKETGHFVYVADVSGQIREGIVSREQEAGELIKRVTGKIDRYLQLENIGRDRNGTSVIEHWLDSSALALLSENFRPESVSAEDRENNRIVSQVMGVLNVIDETFLDDLTTLALGDAIYRSVKNLTEMEAVDATIALKSEPMSKVLVFLDTSVLFKILGYFGEHNRKSSGEFLDICKATGCCMRVFEHTLEELTEGLLAVAQRLRTSSAPYGPVVGYAIENGLDAADIITSASKLEAQLAEHGITLVKKPDHQEHLTIDERALEKQIERALKQENPAARHKDVDSLTSIYRMRDGKGATHLEKCVAIFITSNRTLADTAKKYFKTFFAESGEKNTVQICMTDVVFCTRLWIKLPTASGKTPRLQVL